MSKHVATISLLLALHAFAGFGAGTVLCIGDSGHQRIEPASATCCVDAPSGGEPADAWTADDPCGPCTDFAGASVALSSDGSGAPGSRDRGAIVASRAVIEAESFPEALFLARLAILSARLSARILSPLRV